MNASLPVGRCSVRTGLVFAALAASLLTATAALPAAEASAPVINSPTTANATAGAFFTYQITASDGPTSFGASALPSGLSFDTGIGVISGTPTSAGVYTVGLSAMNASGVGTSFVTIKVSGLPFTSTTIGTTGTFTPSAIDRANRTQPSFGSLTLTSGSALYGSIVGSLVEGSMYSGLEPANSVNSLTPSHGAVAILTFDTTLEPEGYDVARIDVYTGTGQGRAMQNYAVAWAPPGSSTYTPLFAVTNVGTSTTAEVRTSTFDQATAGAGPIATGVGSLRFTFLNTSAPSPESMYREIDVFAPSFAPVITSATTAVATYNLPFSYQITAVHSPTNFAAVGLPDGLSLDASSGIISGIPTRTLGSPFEVTLSATNTVGTGSASLSLTVNKAAASVTLTNLRHTYDGEAKLPSAITSPAGEPVNFSYAGPSLPPVNAGSYSVVGTIAPSSNYTGVASGMLVIERAPAEISLGELTQSYRGTPRTVSASVTPAAAGVVVTYNGAATPPTKVGNYAVVATTTNPNYTGTASGTLIVADTTPPVLSVPPNIIVEAKNAKGSAVTFAASAADDIDGSIPITASPAAGSVFPLGTTTVTVSATDAAGNEARSSFTITVVDTTSPVLSVPANIIVEAKNANGATVSFAASAVDTVDGVVPVTTSAAAGSVFPLGTTIVTVSAIDAAGNASRGSFTITVVDTTAPEFSALNASTTTLWPVDHKMVAITLKATTSDAVSAVTTRITSVTSNEALNAPNDGNTAEDWQITGAMILNLRAERAGDGNSRVYMVTVTATDATGNSSVRSVAITVPKSSDGSI